MSAESSGRPTRLVLITGAGRSGTSAIAGALHHLGLHVPQPVLKANASNPLGFFESSWPVHFHNEIFKQAMIGQTDARPEAFDLLQEVATPQVRDRLRDWLVSVCAGVPQVVVKDPRSLWLSWLWEETAADIGVDISYLTMVRHPAEVIGSRTTYYGKATTERDAWRYAVGNVAAWVNGNLIVERSTRNQPRAIVRYDQLLADWRNTITVVAGETGLTLEPNGPAAAAVDEFISPSLRRHTPSWTGWDLPASLVDLADSLWQTMCVLAEPSAPGHNEATVALSARMDELSDSYDTLMRTAQAIARDTVNAAEQAGYRRGQEETTATMQAEIISVRADARRARQNLRQVKDRTASTQGIGRAVRRRIPPQLKRWLRRLR